MTGRTVRGVLFDMDGVLVDSEYAMRESAKKALHEWGVYPEDGDFIPFVGRGENKFVGGVAERYGVPFVPEMKARAYEIYGDMAVRGEVTVYPGVKELLLWLSSRKTPMAVCSAADWVKVRHNLKAIGVEPEIFGAIVTGEDVKVNKPAPDIYLEGARRLGLSGSECVVAEDAVSGIRAAHAAGAAAVGITTSFSAEELIRQAQPDAVVPDVSGLRAFLEAHLEKAR